MSRIRGKLLYQGIQGRYDDTISGTRKVFGTYVFGCLVAILVAIGGLLEIGTIGGSYLGACFIGFLLFLLCSPFVYAIGGHEIDGIFENGITNRYSNLLDRVTGKSFHKFDDITMIGYGQYTWRGHIKNFVMIFENNSPYPACGSFNVYVFKNDFYERVVETLKMKCPNVKWQRVDFFKFPRRMR